MTVEEARKARIVVGRKVMVVAERNVEVVVEEKAAVVEKKAAAAEDKATAAAGIQHLAAHTAVDTTSKLSCQVVLQIASVVAQSPESLLAAMLLA